LPAERAAGKVTGVKIERLVLGCLTITACGGGRAESEAAKPKPQAIDIAKAAKAAKAVASHEGAAPAEGAADEAGCLHGEKHDGSCEQTERPAPGSVGHFGAPFALPAAEPLAKALASDPLPSGPIRVEGTVEAVCQKKGCWMVLADGNVKARILMKDHAFALPTDARGKKAQVEGTVEKRTLSEAQVKHLAEDAGKDPNAEQGTRVEFVLTATGVELAPTS